MMILGWFDWPLAGEMKLQSSSKRRSFVVRLRHSAPRQSKQTSLLRKRT
jgi:hypothetical protein